MRRAMGGLRWLVTLGALAQGAADVPEPQIRGRTGLISNAFGDHMVLQWSSPRVYGWSSAPNASVTVKLDGSTVGSATSDSKGFWQVDFPRQTASSAPHNITAEALGEATATLSDVLFGDVFFCSGQSNMAFMLSLAYGGQEEIAASTTVPDIRLFLSSSWTCDTNTCPTAAEPQNEFATALQGWSRPDPSSVSSFSAACWFTARALHDRFRTPIGLIQSSYGGTYVEAWSSPEALAECSCDSPDWVAPNVRSGLWNAFVYPLLPMRLRGVMWYQGEANAGSPSCYACSFPAMIRDWRAKFGASKPSQLPFTFVQLQGWLDDGNMDNIAQVRLAQQAALSLPYVGVASATDLGDPESPYNIIHPRDKKDVGLRLAQLLAHFVWNKPEVASPRAQGAALASANAVDVTFGEPVDVRDVPACPAALKPAQCGAAIAEVLGADGQWHPATLAKVAANRVRISATLDSVHGARYMYANYPLCNTYSKKGLPVLPFYFSNLTAVPFHATAPSTIVV